MEELKEELPSIEDLVLARLRNLSVERRKEVLDFVEFLASKSSPKHPRRSLRGLWADLDIQITEEDIDEARREMWGKFCWSTRREHMRHTDESEV